MSWRKGLALVTLTSAVGHPVSDLDSERVMCYRRGEERRGDVVTVRGLW